jgi:hypothetical protein
MSSKKDKLDYSRFDDIDSGSDEDLPVEDLGKNLKGFKTLQTNRAWEEIDRLKQIADGIFIKAEEKQTNKLEYQSAYKHYEETLRFVKGAMQIDESKGIENAKSIIIACNLNAACCCIRSELWNQAIIHCTTVLDDIKDLDLIHQLRARQFRLHSNMKDALIAIESIEQYKKLGINAASTTQLVNTLKFIKLDKEQLDILILIPSLSCESNNAQPIHDAKELLDNVNYFVNNNNINTYINEVESQQANAQSQSQTSNSNPDVIKPEVEAKPKPKSINKKVKAELIQASARLQEASSFYKQKKYTEARDIYLKLVENIPSVEPQEDALVATAENDANGTIDINSLSETERNGLSFLKAVTLSGLGACHTALSEFTLGLTELNIASKTFMNFIDAGIEKLISTDADADADTDTSVDTESNGYKAASFSAEQLFTTTRHAWSNLDNIMECQMRLNKWLKALSACDDSVNLSNSLLKWEKSTNYANTISISNSNPSTKANALNLLKEGKLRKARSLVFKGHLLKDMSDKSNTPEGEKAIIAYKKINKNIDIFEQTIIYWQQSAKMFSVIGNNEDSADKYHLIGEILRKNCSDNLDKKGKLEPYMDWDEQGQRIVDVDMASRAYTFYEYEAKESIKAMERLQAQLIKVNDEIKEMQSSSNKIKLNKDEVDVIEKFHVDILYALQRGMNACLNGAICMLHCSDKLNESASEAIRILDIAHNAYHSYNNTNNKNKKQFHYDFDLKQGTQEHRDFYCILSDCRYHSSLAYYRCGKFQYCIDLLNSTIDSNKTSEDSSRLHMTLGLRSLIYTIEKKNDLAEKDINEVGRTAKAPIEMPEVVMNKIKAYIKRNLPKALSMPEKAPPAMMKLDPKDAARRIIRDAKEKDMREKRLDEMEQSASSSLEKKDGRNEDEDKDKDTGGRSDIALEMKENWKKNSVVAFLIGDGVGSLITAWGLIILCILAIYYGGGELKRRLAEAQAHAQSQAEEGEL